MTTLQDTPRASRLHIGLFGRRNSGKSSLLNALIGQSLAVVSEKPGTTTDPVYKSMEIAGIGPVVFIDTAGFDDDEAELGAARVQQTERAAAETDIALVLFQPTADESAGGDEERGYEIASSVMKKGISIITPNGRTARGVYRAANEAGLKIGKDVAVFALGRSLSRGEFTPSLSYAAQDYGVLGRTAVDLLLEEIDNGRQMEPVLVQSDVIVAESSPEF